MVTALVVLASYAVAVTAVLVRERRLRRRESAARRAVLLALLARARQ